MLAGMAHVIFSENLHDQKFIDRFVLGMDKGTLPPEHQDAESFKSYILGTRDGIPEDRPNGPGAICGVKADILWHACTRPPNPLR